jgi:predicted phosphodiesterase
MRVAVISDVHGNLHALEAVLRAVERESPDELWCLGDLVGYGPRPNEVAALVRDRADVCLVGNHDLVALDAAGVSVEEFNPEARAAALWTRAALDEETRRFLERLEPQAEREGVSLYHASARDAVWEYVLSPGLAASSLNEAERRLVLVGHSHLALVYALPEGAREAAGGLAPAGTEIALEGGRWLLNPGSVGQPRDGDPRAAWLMLDLAARRAQFRRVDYEIASTQAEMAERGLPPALAERLAAGV